MITLERNGNTISLAGALTGPAVAEAHAFLLAALDPAEAASLDLSGVEAIDTRGVQLVASFLRSREDNGVGALSAAVEAYLTRLGARSLVGLQP